MQIKKWSIFVVVFSIFFSILCFVPWQIGFWIVIHEELYTPFYLWVCGVISTVVFLSLVGAVVLALVLALGISYSIALYFTRN